MNVGEIENFDVTPFLQAANRLFSADEFERGILILDNLPSYYRDNQPKEVVDLKAKAYARMVSIVDYASNEKDMIFNLERALAIVQEVPRGIEVCDFVKKHNNSGVTPHIVDMGPGEYWLALGLKQLGLNFTYYGHGLNKKQELRVKDYLGNTWQDESCGVPTLFNATEIIEHLPKPKFDIPQLFYRKCPNAECILITTPLYHYKTNEDWDDHSSYGGYIEHLRAYTPAEFAAAVRDMFPGYQLEFKLNRIMMIKGTIKSKE